MERETEIASRNQKTRNRRGKGKTGQKKEKDVKPTQNPIYFLVDGRDNGDNAWIFLPYDCLRAACPLTLLDFAPPRLVFPFSLVVHLAAHKQRNLVTRKSTFHGCRAEPGMFVPEVGSEGLQRTWDLCRGLLYLRERVDRIQW